MEIQLEIAAIAITKQSPVSLVFLRKIGGQTKDSKDALVMMTTDNGSAYAILEGVEKMKVSRPRVHDLFKNSIEALGGRIQKVVINDYKDENYYALIHIKRDDKVVTVDSRPTDALALAARANCPIYIEESALEKGKMEMERFESEQLAELMKNIDTSKFPRA
jgi:bifunctional DNase/RNase